MKKLFLLTTFYLIITGISNAQSILDNSTFRVEFILSDKIENQYDTLVQVNLIIDVVDINTLSKIMVFGGSEEGLSDKVFKSIDPKDQTLIDSKKLLFSEDKNITINMGLFNLAKSMIYFNIKLEDTSGNTTSSLVKTN